MDDAFIEILALAAIAGFLFFRLRDVLGKRIGNEEPPEWLRGAGLGGQPAAPASPESAADALGGVAAPDQPTGRALLDANQIEPGFDPREFMRRAGDAYEYILMAFEQGDKNALRPLLNDDVYRSFSQAIDDRTSKGYVVESRFLRLNQAELEGARFDRVLGRLEIDVRFGAELITAARDAGGAVVHGDPNVPVKTADLWTFARKMGDADPNWSLIATGD